MKIFALSLFLIGAADAATKVAVVELGVGGAVRRTSSESTETTAEGVSSFFRAMHTRGKLQHAGLPVVPDLFSNAEAGVVVGLSGSGVKAESMPSVASLFNEDEMDAKVVGHLETKGHHCKTFVSKAKTSEEVTSGISEAIEKAAEKKSLAGVKMTVNDSTTADAVDKDLGALIREMDAKSKNEGKTVVLYLVVEEEDAVVEQRRRLEDANDADGQQQGKYYFFKKQQYYNNQEGGNAGQQDNNPFAQMFAGYYGYGYYNSYGEWVTPYYSMFQIQYFNVVLWTAIGLFLVLLSTILLMMYMPLEPDTLLFGESAKVIGDD